VDGRKEGGVKRCAVLIVNSGEPQTAHRQAFERRGFLVVETRQWPDDDVVKGHEVVIVVLKAIETMHMLAARLRAKPHFGHRVLIAMCPSAPRTGERRDALVSGFDDVVPESCGSRALLARVLRRLRARPQYRCMLPDRKRPAA
jgi:hypothetical protein